MPDKSYNIEGNNNDISITINLKKKNTTKKESSVVSNTSGGVSISDIVKEIQNDNSDLSKEINLIIEKY